MLAATGTSNASLRVFDKTKLRLQEEEFKVHKEEQGRSHFRGNGGGGGGGSNHPVTSTTRRTTTSSGGGTVSSTMMMATATTTTSYLSSSRAINADSERRKVLEVGTTTRREGEYECLNFTTTRTTMPGQVLSPVMEAAGPPASTSEEAKNKKKHRHYYEYKQDDKRESSPSADRLVPFLQQQQPEVLAPCYSQELDIDEWADECYHQNDHDQGAVIRLNYRRSNNNNTNRDVDYYVDVDEWYDEYKHQQQQQQQQQREEKGRLKEQQQTKQKENMKQVKEQEKRRRRNDLMMSTGSSTGSIDTTSSERVRRVEEAAASSSNRHDGRQKRSSSSLFQKNNSKSMATTNSSSSSRAAAAERRKAAEYEKANYYNQQQQRQSSSQHLTLDEDEKEQQQMVSSLSKPQAPQPQSRVAAERRKAAGYERGHYSPATAMEKAKVTANYYTQQQQQQSSSSQHLTLEEEEAKCEIMDMPTATATMNPWDGTNSASDLSKTGVVNPNANYVTPGAYTSAGGRINPLRFSVLHNSNTELPPMQMVDNNNHNNNSLAFENNQQFEDEPTTTTVANGNRFYDRHPSQQLAVANLVQEDDDDPIHHLPQAEGVDMDGSFRKKRESEHKRLNQRRQTGFAIGMFLIFAIVSTIVMVLVPDWGGSGSLLEDGSTLQATSGAPSFAPSESPTLSLGGYVESLLPPNTLKSILEDPESPQAMAFNWTMNDPYLSTYSADRIIQRFALVVVYYSTGGPGWRNTHNWLYHEHHECSWYAVNTLGILTAAGILRDLTPTYKEVVLPRVNQSIACQDPNNSDDDDDHHRAYTHLLLVLNNVQGSLPPELYLLTSLKGILLAPNPGLTGPGLPTQIGMLTNLETILMTGSQLTGTIPTEVALLTNLHTFHVGNNMLTGTIPSEIALLSNSLKLLELHRNHLTGTIPTVLGSLQEVLLFNVHHNDGIVGTIPSELGNLKSVSWLSLSKSSLEGTIPPELGNLQNLKELYLYSNSLTGSIPYQLTNLVDTTNTNGGGNLELLFLYNNVLSGSIPEDLCWIETVTETIPDLKNQSLVGCPCNCTFVYEQFEGQQLCSPSPSRCS